VRVWEGLGVQERLGVDALMAGGGVVSWLSRVGEVHAGVPFIVGGAGDIVPQTVFMYRGDPSRWLKIVNEPVMKISKRRIARPPSTITLVLDSSGSTFSSWLGGFRRYTGYTVNRLIDIEIVVALSMLYSTSRIEGADALTRVNLVLFGSSMEGYDRMPLPEAMRLLAGHTVNMMGTKILDAVSYAWARHVDSENNFFLLITDADISRHEAEYIVEMLGGELRRSPILLVVVNPALNPGIEEVLMRLDDRRRGRRVVVIRNAGDVGRLVEAVRDVSNYVLLRSVVS